MHVCVQDYTLLLVFSKKNQDYNKDGRLLVSSSLQVPRDELHNDGMNKAGY